MGKAKNLLIYVVEDNLMYNRLVCENLKRQDFTNVKSFDSGNDCLKSVKSGEFPDVVIQDYQLKDSTGISVLQAVKKISKNSEFIFLTSNENVEIAVNTIKFGAYDYIIKDNDVALEKVVDKINKIAKMIQLKHKDKTSRLAMIILSLILVLIIISGLLLFAFGIIHTD